MKQIPFSAVGTIGHSYAKEEEEEESRHRPTPFTKINSKQITDFTCKMQNYKTPKR